jgi:hypothetical protein
MVNAYNILLKKTEKERTRVRWNSKQGDNMQVDIQGTKRDCEDWIISDLSPVTGSYGHIKDTSGSAESGLIFSSNRQILAFQGGFPSWL